MAEKLNSKSSLEWISIGMTLVFLFASADAQASAESSEVHSNRMFYVCPPEFIRLGMSCYYFSKEAASWQNAHFACQDRESHLTAPERWEDKHLRDYLNGSGIEKQKRWIGGTYDHEEHAWKWGGEMRAMNYQSFARMRRLQPEQLKWHCIAMVPEIEYRWDPINCIEKNYYICQVKIRKVHKTERNRLRQKWNPNGNGHKPNEIQVPSVTTNDLYNKQEDNEIRPDFRNRIDFDSNAIPVPQQRNKYRNNNRTRPTVNNNPKYYIAGNLRKKPNITDYNAFSYRPSYNKDSNGPNMKRKKPFRGYKENKENPESAYKHNVKALKSGRTGLSEAQVEKHLKRLERMRKKDMAMQRQKERRRERLNKERSINGDQNENENILHDRILNIKNRNLIDDPSSDRKNPKSKSRNKNNKKKSHSIENITQKTYTMNNQLSVLHPKTIVEVHGISNE